MWTDRAFSLLSPRQPVSKESRMLSDGGMFHWENWKIESIGSKDETLNKIIFVKQLGWLPSKPIGQDGWLKTLVPNILSCKCASRIHLQKVRCQLLWGFFPPKKIIREINSRHPHVYPACDLLLSTLKHEIRWKKYTEQVQHWIGTSEKPCLIRLVIQLVQPPV